MIGISVAADKEWEAVLDRFNLKVEDCLAYPFGEIFRYH